MQKLLKEDVTLDTLFWYWTIYLPQMRVFGPSGLHAPRMVAFTTVAVINGSYISEISTSDPLNAKLFLD